MVKSVHQIWLSIFMAIFVSVVQLYTWITLLVYFILQKPWIARARNDRCRIKISNLSSSEINTTESTITPIYVKEDLGTFNHVVFEFETLTDIFDAMPKMHGPNKASLGFRQILFEEELFDSTSKAFCVDGHSLKRYKLSEYKWLSFEQVATITKNLAQGLMAKGIIKNDKILIISETCVEWMICFQGILRTGATVVTIYSNLGINGVVHSIEETETETIITSLGCISLLKSAADKAKHSIKRIIYIDGFKKLNELDFGSGIEVLSLSEIEELGKQKLKKKEEKPYTKASLDDPVVIMYTSGTTDEPKAAVITQRQMMASIKALFVLVRHLTYQARFHIYVSYLPLAHVMELTLEIFFYIFGVRLGYATPFTLMDISPGLCPGQKSDLGLLKPTIMTTVPLVLERVIKQINDMLASRSPVLLPIFQFLIDYKSKWTRLGYRCNIITYLLCPPIKQKFGGNLKHMICGGAPLDATIQAMIKSALDINLIQGYGATELTGAAISMDFDILEYGYVGSPMGNVFFRLRDWNEGGYSVKDQPNPRGEILIGGDLVAVEYFKKPELTKEAFINDKNGIRWFKTGDIGEMYPNGSIKIIDRLKSIIKLQNGEYISLGKVEATLRLCNIVENICVYGGVFSNEIVALISPNRKVLNKLASELGKDDLNIKEKCNDPQIEKIVYKKIVDIAKKASLNKKEIPQRIKLIPEVWSPNNNILTSAMKLKRRVVESMYKQELNDLYNIKNSYGANKFDCNNNENM